MDKVCPTCSGIERPWSFYRCKEHDVCVTCKTPRNELKETPWGHRDGFECKPCADVKKAIALRIQMDKFNEAHYDDFDFRNNDEIKCPYCGTDHEACNESIGRDGSESEFECHICDNTFIYYPEYSVTFSSMKKERS